MTRRYAVLTALAVVVVAPLGFVLPLAAEDGFLGHTNDATGTSGTEGRYASPRDRGFDPLRALTEEERGLESDVSAILAETQSDQSRTGKLQRRSAIQKLRHLRHTSAVPTLKTVVCGSAEEHGSRQRAVVGLQWIRDMSSVRALVDCLECVGDDPILFELVLRALKRLTDQSYGYPYGATEQQVDMREDLIEKWQAWLTKNGQVFEVSKQFRTL